MANRGPYGKGDVTAAREFLAGMPEFTEHSKKGAFGISEPQALRVANSFARQVQAGITPNYQAARGHILTPEHPRSARPILPEPAERYIARRVQGRVPGVTPEPAPVVHNRLRGRSHIPYQENGEIYTRNTTREALEVLRYTEALEPQGGVRLTMQVYDCSQGGRRGDNGWFQFLSHTWGAGGIRIDDLFAMWDAHGGSFEDFVMDTINGKSGKGDSDKSRHGRINHVCQYEITILPRPVMVRTS